MAIDRKFSAGFQSSECSYVTCETILLKLVTMPLSIKLLCVQVGVAYIEFAVSECADFSIAGSVDPEVADLLRAKGSRTVTKFTLVTLTRKNEDKKSSQQ